MYSHSIEAIVANTSSETLPKSESRVLHVRDFVRDLPKKLTSERGLVLFQTMALESGHAMQPIINALIERGKLGLPTHVTVDGFVDGVTKDVSNYLRRFVNDGGWRDLLELENQNTLRALRACGVKLERTNLPKNHLQKLMAYGFFRDHRKLYRIGDSVYFGGINLTDSIFEQLDFLVEIKDCDLVNQLTKQFFRVNAFSPRQNERIVYDGAKILVDCGDGSSIIQDETIDLINSAKVSLDLMTQSILLGTIGKHLNKAADRGVKVRLFTSKHEGTVLSGLSFIDQNKIEVHFPVEGHTHAKLLVADGKTAIFGSHNFNIILVKSHTKEMSILTTRQHIVTPLVRFFDDTLAGKYRQSPPSQIPAVS